MKKKVLRSCFIVAFVFLLGGCSQNVKEAQEYQALQASFTQLEEQNKKLQNEKSEVEARFAEESKKVTTAENKVKEAERKYKDIEKKYRELEEEVAPYLALSKAEAEAQKTQLEEEKALKKAEEEAKKAEEQAAKEEEKRLAEERKKEEESRGYETGITYEQLARTPDDYKGKKVKFEGKIIQVMEGTGVTHYRFAVNDDYDTIAYLEAKSNKVGNERILEDDYLTVNGVSFGLYSYKSTMGGQITIPGIIVDSFE